METPEKFGLRWNDFESNIRVAFREIWEEKDFFDCTLTVGDKQIQAHKLILSACSPFFRSVFKKNPHQHPLLYLKGIEFSYLQSVLNFMYYGEVNVAQEDLTSFLAVAEDLKVKGLTPWKVSCHSTPVRKPCPPQLKRSCPPPAKRPCPPPEAPSQQECETTEEVMTVVKNEPMVSVDIEHQPIENDSQQPIKTDNTGGAIAPYGDQLGYGEDDGFAYVRYDGLGEGEQDWMGWDAGRGKDDSMILRLGPKSVQCQAPGCGKIFSRQDSCRRHIKEIHNGVSRH